MRILHTESSCGWGGQEIRVIEEACGFSSRGHDVVIAASPVSRIAVEASRRGLPVRTVPIDRKHPSGVLALRRLFREFVPDVVNTHSSTDSWIAALACVLFGASPPLVRTRHISALIPANPASMWLYRRAVRHVVTTGDALRNQVIRETGLPARRVSSVPTGIDLARFTPGCRAAARERLGLPKDVFLVGIVATLRSWKGHRYLVDALSEIQDESVRLVIVGDGPGRDPVREQISALGLQARVHLAGEQDDVVPWLQSMDLFALPSYANEGVPQAIMQAMACAIPVLTTRVGAIEEIVSDGLTGVFVPPRDAAAIASGIKGLRGNSQSLAGMGLEGRRVAVQRFSRERMLDAMESIFIDALSGPMVPVGDGVRPHA